MSVAIHLASPNSAGLFQAALMESGLAEGYPTLPVPFFFVNLQYPRLTEGISRMHLQLEALSWSLLDVI